MRRVAFDFLNSDTLMVSELKVRQCSSLVEHCLHPAGLTVASTPLEDFLLV